MKLDGRLFCTSAKVSACVHLYLNKPDQIASAPLDAISDLVICFSKALRSQFQI